MSEEVAILLGRVAGLLLVNGQTTEGTRIAVERLGQAQGWPVRLFVRWGEYVVQDLHRSVIGEATPTGIDIARVLATEAVVDAVCDRRMDVPDALRRLERIGRSAPVALARLAPMAAAGAAALGVVFGATDWRTLGLIAASAGGGALVRRAVSRVSANPLLQPFAASLLAGLAGGLAARSGVPIAEQLVVACPCMVLVPGPHFLNGSVDLVRARIPIGAARIGLALLVVLAICGGLLAGLALAGAGFPRAGAATAVPFADDVLAAGVAVAAYGSFFNMPWRLMAAPVVIGMAAHALRWSLLHHGASLQLGAFGATLFVGLATSPLAHRFRLPFGASAFAAVVSLIPGLLMFEAAASTLTMVDLGTGGDTASLLSVATSGATAAIVLMAMTAGLILPKLGFDAVSACLDRR